MMTLEEYLTPDPNIRDARPWSEFTPDPLPSLSSREMSLHSAISVHGYLPINGRKVWYESVLERCCALLARLRPDVTEIVEQPLPAHRGSVPPHRLNTGKRKPLTATARKLHPPAPSARIRRKASP